MKVRLHIARPCLSDATDHRRRMTDKQAIAFAMARGRDVCTPQPPHWWTLPSSEEISRGITILTQALRLKR